MSDRAWQPFSSGPGVAAPAGAYSPVVRAGDFVFVAGQIPKHPETGELVGTDVRTQTVQVLENLRAALALAGATLDDIVQIGAFLANEDDWGTFNEIYGKTLRAPYPTRTTVGVSLRGGVLVEVNAVAYVRR